MHEYHVSFRKVIAGDRDEVYAQVSDNDPLLIRTVDTIRERIESASQDAGFELRAIPNGHFMEIEFLLDDDRIRGVVFMTPYLPTRFAAIVRDVLAEVGIEGVF